jgi:transposase-like protein
VEILVIYVDGQRFGAHHILSAVGVDREGRKHVLGIESGATENAASVKRLPFFLDLPQTDKASVSEPARSDSADGRERISIVATRKSRTISPVCADAACNRR